MVFSSITFIFFFLPAVLAAYHLAPRRVRNGLLVFASLGFYAWGAGAFVLALLASIATNYVIGAQLERRVDRGETASAKRLLALGVVVNVALLGWFKYANLGVATWNAGLTGAGLPTVPWADVLLPIGISFFTFHSLSYLVDVYRGTARHLVSPLDFALYITFFPQLIAGPIVRFHEIRDQLVQRKETFDAFAAGVYRFGFGLAKKVVIADTVAPIANAAFGVPTDELNTTAALVGVLAYTVQLYFDFSGYSDMALGLALMFGIRFPENFDRPYASRSITEFWRRWHMSLSRWFRDYLYVSLGGNRGSAAATYRNLVIVFLVTGLWHGANWTFVAWGAYHGILLLLERVAGVARGRGPRPRPWQAVTIVLVMSVVGVAALIASLVGGLRPAWLVGALLASGWMLIVGTYFVLFWSSAGQTPGMRLLRVRVQGPDGNTPSISRSLMRLVGLVLAIVPMFAGFIPVLFTERRRGLPDFLGSTVVLYDDTRT